MKTALLLILVCLPFVLTSCSNDYFQSDLGHYKKVLPTDPDAEFGIFTKQPSAAVAVTPEK